MAASSHALLGPSSSHRWLHCTPSARLEEQVPDKGSDFAQEGSCAHALCEEKLYTLLGDDMSASSAVLEQIANDRERWYNTEMENCAEEYVAIVWNKYQESLQTTPDAKLFIERRLDFSSYIPESFGTADAIIIADGTMEVIDFKYGKGVEVSAVENSQMMIYALGALAEFEMEYNIERVRMTIIQPRMHNYSEYEINALALQGWGVNTLKHTADRAWAGEGEQVPGEWCRFCKIKAKCAKLANQAVAAYTQHEQKDTISDEDYPALLALIPAIKSWCSAVGDYATAQAISGKQYEGYKLVEGRSICKIVNEDELIGKLNENGWINIYKKPELLSIGELERMIGKKEFARIADGFIDKPKGKPTLVPNSDKRQPLNTSSAIEDFTGLD